MEKEFIDYRIRQQEDYINRTRVRTDITQERINELITSAFEVRKYYIAKKVPFILEQKHLDDELTQPKFSEMDLNKLLVDLLCKPADSANAIRLKKYPNTNYVADYISEWIEKNKK